MSVPEPSPALERYSAAAVGVLLLLLAASMFGWGVRLAFAALLLPAGWPPGLEKLLLPIAVTALVVGFGAWRLMRMGLPARLFGVPLGWAVVAVFGVAGLAGAAV